MLLQTAAQFRSVISIAFCAAAEMPDFSIPEADAEYTGDPANNKDQVSHRKQLAQLELQAQVKKVCSYTAAMSQQIARCISSSPLTASNASVAHAVFSTPLLA